MNKELTCPDCLHIIHGGNCLCTKEEIKTIINNTCKRLWPSLCSEDNRLTEKQKELARELIQYAYEGIDVYSDHTGSHYCRNIDGILKELGLDD